MSKKTKQELKEDYGQNIWEADDQRGLWWVPVVVCVGIPLFLYYVMGFAK